MSEALLEAIRVGDAAAVERLATPETVNAAGPGGVTPLMAAAVWRTIMPTPGPTRAARPM